MTDDKPSILAIGCNPRNLELLARVLEKHGFHAVLAESLEEFDRALAGDRGLALALVDVTGFDDRIWERCARLRGRHVPFFILSCRDSPEIRRECLAHGAQGVLVKPLSIDELLKSIEGLLEQPQ